MPTWMAHLIEKREDRWEPAAGKAFDGEQAEERARRFAEDWESKDPTTGALT
jgi:hypothetical protein